VKQVVVGERVSRNSTSQLQAAQARHTKQAAVQAKKGGGKPAQSADQGTHKNVGSQLVLLQMEQRRLLQVLLGVCPGAQQECVAPC
jgi:hypothetical protein